MTLTPTDATPSAFDAEWETRYREGYIQRYPWDRVVSFVFRNAPKHKPRTEVSLLELGSGSGSNLWFAAREGFRVAGVEGSETAVAWARRRFERDGLIGDLRVGDFTQPLPFADAAFDLVIDRGSLVCVGFSAARRTIRETFRVLEPGGAFLFNPYSRAHGSAMAGRRGEDGLVHDIVGGSLVGVGALCFYDEAMVRQIVADGWDLVALTHVEQRSALGGGSPTRADADVHAEWSVVLRKPGGAA